MKPRDSASVVLRKCGRSSRSRWDRACMLAFTLAMLASRAASAAATHDPSAASWMKSPSEASAPHLSAPSARLSDEVVARDLAIFDSWKRRLSALAEIRPPRSLYHRAKAEAWLDLARQEYLKNDESGFVEAALAEATRLIQGLEADRKDLGTETPHLAGSTRMRNDLWGIIERIHGDPGFPCVEAEVAKMEVELSAAGHDASRSNPCYAEARVRAVEVLADVTLGRAAPCGEQPRVASPSLPTPTMVEVQKRIEKLPHFVHFALDSAKIIPSSAKVLNQIAEVMRLYPQISVDLSGHADKRGSEAYNLGLSQRRARAVYDYLIAAGVDRDRVRWEYYGKSRPRVADETIAGFARNRCVIFTYTASSIVEVEAEPQEGDLQIEKERQRQKERRQRRP